MINYIYIYIFFCIYLLLNYAFILCFYRYLLFLFYCTITQLCGINWQWHKKCKNSLKWLPKLAVKGLLILAHVLGIEHCHLHVRGKTLGITVKERKCNDHIYPAEVHRDSFIFSSVSSQFFFMFQLLATLWYQFCEYIYIYFNILKHKKIYLYQRLESVVVWCILNCLLLHIMLHKFAEMSLSLCVCVCVCYVYPFTLLCIYVLCILCPGHLCTPLCVCVCEHACSMQSGVERERSVIFPWEQRAPFWRFRTARSTQNALW